MNDNFYLWLELPLFNMVENDGTNLESILNKKSREWSNGASRNSKMKLKYSKIDEIRKAINNSAQWRKIYQDACRIVKTEIENNIKVNPNINMDWITKFSKDNKCDIRFIKKILRENGRMPELDELPEPNKTFNSSIQVLKRLDCVSIYDFLDKFGYKCEEYGEQKERLKPIYQSITNWQNASTRQLFQASDEIWQIWHVKGSSQKQSDAKNICSTIKKIDSNEMKYEYDYFLIYNEVFSLINRKIEVLKSSKSPTISPNDANQLVQELNKLTEDDANYSRRVLSKYLSSKGIIPPIQCPACKKYVIASMGKCSCGFNIGDYNKINQLCIQIFELLNKYKFKEAKDILDKANNLQKNVSIKMDNLEKLNEDYSRNEKLFSKEFNILKSLLDDKKLYTAQKKYQDIQRKFNNFEDSSIENTINNGINKCNELCSKALKNPENKVALYVSALEIASDCEVALDFFNTLEIFSPTNIRVSKNRNYDINISWTPSRTQFATYTVIRKENEVPFNINDGVVIASKIKECRIKDENIINGKCYYYSVYANIGNKTSDMIISKEFYITKAPEIDNINPSNQKVSIKLKNLNANNVEIITVRKENQPPNSILDGEKVISNVYGFDDTNVKNDIEYYYRIFAKYNINGQEMYSDGILQKAIPFLAPNPVEKINILPTNIENKFKISIVGEVTLNNVEFYYTENIKEEIPFKKGDKVDKFKIDNTFKKLDTEFQNDNFWNFNIPENVSYRIFAITNTKTNLVVMGSNTVITNSDLPKIKEVSISGYELSLFIENWSDNVAEIYVISNNTGYVDEFNLTKLNTYSTFNSDIRSKNNTARVTIPSRIEQKKYYFSLFSKFTSGEISKPVHAFKNLEPKKMITYTYSRKLLKNHEFKFLFKNLMTDKLENKKNIQVAIVYNTSRKPLTITDGVILNSISINSAMSTTRLNLVFPERVNINATYIGVFFVNSNDFETYQLLNKTNPTGKLL